MSFGQLVYHFDFTVQIHHVEFVVVVVEKVRGCLVAVLQRKVYEGAGQLVATLANRHENGAHLQRMGFESLCRCGECTEMKMSKVKMNVLRMR